MVTSESKSQTLNVRVLEEGPITWVNIERPTESEMEYLRERYAFHPLDLEDCLSRVQVPKIDRYESYLFIVLHFPLFNKQARITLPSEVDLFVGPNYLVTVHDGTLKPLTKLWEACQSSDDMRADVLRRSGGYLLYRVLSDLVDYCFPILRKITGNVNDIGFKIFDDSSMDLVRDIHIVRRDVIAYRRIIHPQIGVLEDLEKEESPILRLDPDVYFGDLADQTRRIWAELEELKEVIEGLSSSHDSLVNHQTNRIIRILTIISTMLLPLTFISGVYGMNVNLPLDDNPFAFLVVISFMLLVAGGMLLYFRSRHWI